MIPITDSYLHCRRVTRRRAKNFYWAFRLLDAQRRDSLCAVYAFMRRCDDLSDEPGAPASALDAWRGELDRGLRGMLVEDRLWPAFFDTVARYKIPRQYFHDMIDGVASDLTRTSIATFDELYRYCYRVASVAGLSLVHIFGYRDPEALALAEKCGIAFQLTNIIRDVAEDAGLGRTYLPAEDMERFQVTAEHLRASSVSAELRRLLRFEAGRAFEYYDASRPLIGMVEPETRPALAALIEIYRRLLNRIEQRDYEVLARRIRLSTAEKVSILVKARLQSWK
ncbi:MAG: phytoene/squalene synthase family protein [Bryobacteraceae bacterium]